MSAHTPCGPSSLERRALCPGSLSQELALGSIEEQSTEEAESGTQCHKAMEAYLTGADIPPLTDEENAKFKKALDSLESILQGDTIDPVTMTTKSGGKVHIELRMESLPYWHGEVGTVDFVIDYLDHILMLDWKFGGGFVPSPSGTGSSRPTPWAAGIASAASPSMSPRCSPRWATSTTWSRGCTNQRSTESS